MLTVGGPGVVEPAGIGGAGGTSKAEGDTSGGEVLVQDSDLGGDLRITAKSSATAAPGLKSRQLRYVASGQCGATLNDVPVQVDNGCGEAVRLDLVLLEVNLSSLDLLIGDLGSANAVSIEGKCIGFPQSKVGQ